MGMPSGGVILIWAAPTRSSAASSIPGRARHEVKPASRNATDLREERDLERMTVRGTPTLQQFSPSDASVRCGGCNHVRLAGFHPPT